jgi:hypothetical protein
MQFPVDKTNRTIKAILEKSVGVGWRGREVFVDEVPPSWTYRPGSRDHFLVTADGRRQAIEARTVQWLEQDVRPTADLVLVVEQRRERAPQSTRKATATIYIPQLDHAQMDVARDALLVGDKQLIATALEPFGLYAGIARAILERQLRSFAKATNPKKSTKQIRREVDDFLRAQGRL